jgi:hypothetical protein
MASTAAPKTPIQMLLRGQNLVGYRNYADDVVDLKTRALCTMACLVAIGEQPYIENWMTNAITAGSTVEEITSLLGQLVAPSVTKGCAVAKLESDLAPVPEDCRPKPSALRAAFSAYRLTFDEAHKARAALDQQQQQQQQASNGGGSCRG